MKAKVPLPPLGGEKTAPEPLNGQKPPENKQDLKGYLPENEDAVVTTTIKYNKPKPEAQPQQTAKQAPPLANNFNTFIPSENPLLDFLSYWRQEEDEDVYILATRLPDNPLAPNEFFNQCTSARVLPIFPLNVASFQNDLVKLNGNSGGYFKVIAVNANMEDLGGEVLKRFAVANPLIDKSATPANNNETGMMQILKEMQEQNQKNFQAMVDIQNNKKDEFAELAKTLLVKRLADLDKPPAPSGNPLSGLPEETQAMVSFFQNPVATKAVSLKVNEMISSFFTEKPAEDAAKKGNWIENILLNVANNPEMLGQTMSILEKGLGAVMLGLSKIGANKPPRRRNPNQAPQNPAARQQNPAAKPQTQETPSDESFIDVEVIEHTEAENVDFENYDNLPPEDEYLSEEEEYLLEVAEIKASPIFTEIVNYIDSDEDLKLENKFMELAKQANKIRFIGIKAMMKEATFDEALALILGDYPFIQEMIEEKPRRLQRLTEFHKLLQNS